VYRTIHLLFECRSSSGKSRATFIERIPPRRSSPYQRTHEKILIRSLSSCLLGIFGVRMSLFYSEGGEEAFIQLQKTIMKKSDDHSLFAWSQNQGPSTPSTPSTHGLLASSPASFAGSSSLIRIPYLFEPQSAYRMSNRGLKIRLSLTCTLDGKDHMVTLGCADSKEHIQGDTKKHPIGIYVALTDDNRFVRTRLDQLVKTQPPRSDYKRQTLETLYFPRRSLLRSRLERFIPSGLSSQGNLAGGGYSEEC
jgi:hypothetical protein